MHVSTDVLGSFDEIFNVFTFNIKKEIKNYLNILLQNYKNMKIFYTNFTKILKYFKFKKLILQTNLKWWAHMFLLTAN